MLKLLKADFYKILKSKLLIIGLIFACAMPLFFTGLCLLINEAAKFEAALSDHPYVPAANAYFAIKLSLSLASVFLIVLPIFSGIFICNDISSGSLRNKIIIGKSRTSIYLSHLIVTLAFTITLSLLFISFSLLFNFLILPGVEMTSNSIQDILLSSVNTLLLFVFVSTAVTFISLSSQSVPLTILGAIAFGLILPYITMMISIFEGSFPENAKYWLSIIPTYSSSTGFAGIDPVLMGSTESDSLPQIIGVISYLAFSGLFTFLGLRSFVRKDIK